MDTEKIYVDLLKEINEAIVGNRNLLSQVEQSGDKTAIASWNGQYLGLKHALNIVGKQLIESRQEKVRE